MNRHILTFDLDRTPLVGTHHAPGTRVVPRTDVGVLFLNAGAAPRSGNSDLSVHAADSLAGLGFHALRFDLPGLGDSFGESAVDIQAYWRQVVAGRNDGVTAALIASVRKRLGIRALIIGGLCAGSVTSIRVAAAGTPGVAGLILFEPEFRLFPGLVGFRTRSKPGAAPNQSVDAEIPVPSPLKRKMHGLLNLLGVKAFPVDTNLPLLNGWHSLLVNGLPSFVAVAEGLASHAYIRTTQRRLSARARGSLGCIVVEGTNHILTSGDARRGTIAGIEQWMARAFAISQKAMAGSDSRSAGLNGLSGRRDSL